MKIEEISFFTPAWNEEAHVEATVTKVDKILKKTAPKYEIIIINDGSKDKTGEIADRLAKENEHIHVIHHPTNRGYGWAIKSGLYNARYEWISFIDVDGQFDFNEITKFFEVQKKTGADLVVGYYLKRQVPFYRILASKLLWELPVFLLFGLKARDIDCGFKVIRKEVMDKIPKLEAGRGPFISSELLIKAQKTGFKIAEVGVHHYSRKAGKASGIDLNVILTGYFDLLRLWRKLRKL